MTSKKRTIETTEETSTCESKPSKLVMLNPLDSSLELDIEGDGLRCAGLSVVPLTFKGTRANIGIKKGKYCFSCRVVKNQEVAMEEITHHQQNACVIGISSGDADVEKLGWTRHSFGYVSTGEFSNFGKLYDYGQKFGEGDTILCAVDLEPMVNQARSISFSKNGKSCGPAIHLDAGLELFPHVMLKNVIVEMQFSPEDGLVPEKGYKPWSCALGDGNAVFGPDISGPSESEVAKKRVKENMVGLTFECKPSRAVILNRFDRSLEFCIEGDGLRGSALCKEAFVFHGARANVGIRKGKYYFGCRVVKYLEVGIKDSLPEHWNFCYKGISRGNDDVKKLGSTKHSFAYGSTGKFCKSHRLLNYGEKFGEGDKIVCGVDLNSLSTQRSVIRFSKNGKSFDPVIFYNEGFEFFPHVILKNVIVEMEFSPEDGLVPEEGYKPWSCALHDNTAVFGPGFGGPNKCNFFPESVSSSSHPSCVQSYDPSLQPRYSLTGPVYEKNRQRFGLPLPPVNYNNRRPRQVMNSAYFGSPPQGMVPSLYFKQTSQVASAPNALVTTSPYGSYAPLGGTYGSFQSPFGHTTRHSAPQGMDPSFATTFPYRSYAPLATYGSYQPPPCEENHVLPKRNNRLGTKELSFYEANRSLFEMRNPQSLANNVSPAGVVPYSRPSTHVQPLANNVFPASVASYFRPSIPAQPMANNVYPAGVASYSRPSTPVQPLAYNVSPSCVASYSRLSTPAQPLANNVSPGGVVSYSRPSTPVQPLANNVSPSGAQTYSHPSTPALSGDYLGGLEEDLQRFYSTLPSLDFDDQRPHQVNSAFNESAPQGGIDSSPDFNQIFSVDGVSNAYNYSLNNSIESDVGFNPVVATFPYDNYNPHGAYDSYQSSVMDPHVRPSNGENETFLPPLPQSHDFSPYEVTPATGPTQAQTPTFGNVPENPQPGTGDHPQPQQGGYY